MVQSSTVEIEYVTHAALLLRSARARLLTDPFFYPELDPLLAPGVRNFPPRAIDPAALGRLDYAFSSHEHHDHCHPETLARLAPQIGTVLLDDRLPPTRRCDYARASNSAQRVGDYAGCLN